VTTRGRGRSGPGRQARGDLPSGIVRAPDVAR